MGDPTRFFVAAVAAGSSITGPLAPPHISNRLDEGPDDVVLDVPPIPPRRVHGRRDDAALTHIQEVEDQVRSEGWDTIAFYASFHRYGAQRYGIYFCFDSFAAITMIIVDKLKRRYALNEVWEATYNAILSHEQFHFAVELAAAHAEVLTGSPDLYSARLSRYWNKGMLSVLGQHEEAVATADEIRRARRLSPDVADALIELSQGLAGYGDFEQYLSAAGRRSGQRTILSELVGSASIGELLERQVAQPYLRALPVRWLMPKSLPGYLRDLLPRTFPLPVTKVTAHAHRHGAIVTHRKKHLAIIVEGKPRPVTISPGWGKEIPRRFLRPFAELFDLTPEEYSHQVLTNQ